jgi:branched-subunit amino acid ABC-type transport system permease component
MHFSQRGKNGKSSYAFAPQINILNRELFASRRTIALQLLFTSLGVGSIYALVALGFVLIYRATNVGSSIALKAFAASIIGGFGDVTGAIVGGLALGVVETFGAAYISVPYKDAFAFIVLVLFLLFRPQGLFGEKVAEKA